MLSQVMTDVAERFGHSIRIDLVLGMVGRDGITRQDHEGFLALNGRSRAGVVDTRYTPKGLSAHTKLYVWSKGDEPVDALVGSANFTRFGFLLGANVHSHRELLTRVAPGDAYGEYEQIAADTVAVDSEDIAGKIRFVSRRPTSSGTIDWQRGSVEAKEDGDAAMVPNLGDMDYVVLPLVAQRNAPKTGTVRGEPHKQWGLNWGQRRTGKNEAVIPVPQLVWNRRPGFFPRGVAGDRPQFHVITDDGDSLFLCVAADDEKELHSRPSNARIGEYFRARLGVESGAEVTLQHLLDGGSRFVKVYRTGDDSYHMEYSAAAEAEGAKLYNL